jgi:hypothetical protein
VLLEDESKVGQFRDHVISTNYGISSGQRTFPAGREAIISQFRVWPFLSTIIMTFGERNRNPGQNHNSRGGGGEEILMIPKYSKSPEESSRILFLLCVLYVIAKYYLKRKDTLIFS